MAKTEEIKIKKGQQYTLYATCQFHGCDSEDTFTALVDMTEKDLEEEVAEFVENNIGPEGWYKIV